MSRAVGPVAATFVVDAAPPWKQVPADAAERSQQQERLAALQKEARTAFGARSPFATPCAVTIRYALGKGRADSANIIGGVLDGLEGIAFLNDRQVVKITYSEQTKNQDRYQVTVAEATLL